MATNDQATKESNFPLYGNLNPLAQSQERAIGEFSYLNSSTLNQSNQYNASNSVQNPYGHANQEVSSIVQKIMENPDISEIGMEIEEVSASKETEKELTMMNVNVLIKN